MDFKIAQAISRLSLALNVFAASIFLVLWSMSAHADDSSRGVLLPRLLTKTAGQVRISSASIRIQDDQVELTMSLNVASGPTEIALESQRFGWLGDGETYPDRHFPELEVLRDGARVSLRDSFAAFVGTNEVTQEMLAAGVDPYAIDTTPPFVTPTAGRAAPFERLKRLGAIETDKEGDLARWTVTRKIAVPLGAQNTQTLTLRFTARPAFELTAFSDLAEADRRAKYCLQNGELERALGNPPATRSFEVREYAVPIGVDGAAPKSLRAEIDAARRRPVFVSFCGAEGGAIVGRDRIATSQARTDADGVFRMLIMILPGANK